MDRTVFEHWTDADLQTRMDQAEHSDPEMIEGVKHEIERRATVRAEQERLNALAAEANRKAIEAAAAEEKRKQREARRNRMFHPSKLDTEQRKRLAEQLRTMARVYYFYGGHAEAFVMDVLAMAALDKQEGRALEIVELLRRTDWAERWSMRHPDDSAVVVYFPEVFPETVKQKRGEAA